MVMMFSILYDTRLWTPIAVHIASLAIQLHSIPVELSSPEGISGNAI